MKIKPGNYSGLGVGAGFLTVTGLGVGAGFLIARGLGVGAGFLTLRRRGAGAGLITGPGLGVGAGFMTVPGFGVGAGFLVVRGLWIGFGLWMVTGRLIRRRGVGFVETSANAVSLSTSADSTVIADSAESENNTRIAIRPFRYILLLQFLRSTKLHLNDKQFNSYEANDEKSMLGIQSVSPRIILSNMFQRPKRIAYIVLVALIFATSGFGQSMPKTYAVELVIVRDKKSFETDADITFGDKTVRVVPDKKNLVAETKEFTYSDIKFADQSYSKKPLFSVGGGVTTVVLTSLIIPFIAIPFLFIKKKKHWMTVQTEKEYMVLKLGDKNFRPIAAELETKGVKVGELKEKEK